MGAYHSESESEMSEFLLQNCAEDELMDFEAQEESDLSDTNSELSEEQDSDAMDSEGKLSTDH